MIRVVLAVVVATALLGASLPAAERVERDRNAALATGELQRLADRAERLAADSHALAPTDDPARLSFVVTPPEPVVTDGGRLLVAEDSLVWWPKRGRNRSVDASVAIGVDAPIRITDRTRLHLAFVRREGAAIVHVRRARIQNRSRDQTPRVR